jgi:hypothetical protein
MKFYNCLHDIALCNITNELIESLTTRVNHGRLNKIMTLGCFQQKIYDGFDKEMNVIFKKSCVIDN